MIKFDKVLRSSNESVAKYIYSDDTALVESVIYKYPTYSDRTTICISLQSGCKVGCLFCGTGKKFFRNLSVDEIVLQVEDTFKMENVDHVNVDKLQIMFMSMGEPTHNIDNLVDAIRVLNKKYPSAELLISTIGTNNNDSINKIINISKEIDKVGLQFSIHHYSDRARNKLIPFEDKLSLSEIAWFGARWHKETGRHPFCNYVVTNSNNQGYERLFGLFNSMIFNFTFSVLCSPNESVKSAFINNKDNVKSVHDSFLAQGYNTRVFDPAGQDDIGGGCGQLWYFQKFKSKN